jgi:DNA-binding response OmpR family regulator
MIRMRVVCAAAFALAGTAIAQAPPAQRTDPRSIQLRGNRFKPLTYDEMTPAQKTMLAHLLAGPRAGANGPFNVLLRSPEIGDLVLDLLTREARIDGRDVALSAREFALLAYLMRHPGQVLSRQQILNGVWGYAFDPRSNLVDVYVGYLRRKLLSQGSCPIETVRGMGYRLVPRKAA